MSNKTVLERRLKAIEKYDINSNDHDAFSQKFYESFEALKGIPYSVHQQGRD